MRAVPSHFLGHFLWDSHGNGQVLEIRYQFFRIVLFRTYSSAFRSVKIVFSQYQSMSEKPGCVQIPAFHVHAI